MFLRPKIFISGKISDPWLSLQTLSPEDYRSCQGRRAGRKPKERTQGTAKQGHWPQRVQPTPASLPRLQPDACHRPAPHTAGPTRHSTPFDQGNLSGAWVPPMPCGEITKPEHPGSQTQEAAQPRSPCLCLTPTEASCLFLYSHRAHGEQKQ